MRCPLPFPPLPSPLLRALFLALLVASAAVQPTGVAHAAGAGERERVASPSPLVAHAGGTAAGETLTNTREALDSSAAHGFRLVEVDFAFTSDGYLVLIHDWHSTPARLFDLDARPEGPMSRQEFRAAASRFGLTHMTLDDLAGWLVAHPAVDVITDCKTDNLEVLAHIASEQPALRGRFVPQIYAPSEHEAVAALGYARIILTLYVTRGATSNEDVLRYAAERSPYAVTMPVYRTRSGLPGKLTAGGVFVYAHTVDDPAEVEALQARGVSGFYTDWLRPSR